MYRSTSKIPVTAGLILLLIVFSNTAAFPGTAVGLDASVRTALENNPALRIAGYTLQENKLVASIKKLYFQVVRNRSLLSAKENELKRKKDNYTLVSLLVGGIGIMNIMLVSFFFALIVGIVFGLYPAMNAAKLNPIEALRYE